MIATAKDPALQSSHRAQRHERGDPISGQRRTIASEVLQRTIDAQNQNSKRRFHFEMFYKNKKKKLIKHKPAQLTDRDHSKGLSELSDAELDARIAPILSQRNALSAAEMLGRKQKEHLLGTYMKTAESENTTPQPTEIVQRFVNVLTMPQNNLSAISEEFRRLRVFIASNELNWLTDFYGKGGAIPFVKMLAKLSSSLETRLTTSSQTAEQIHVFATVIQEALSILRSLLNTSIGVNNCFEPSLELSTIMFDLLYICNNTDDESFTSIISELVRILKVLPAVEFYNKNLGSMSDHLLQGLDRVAAKRNQPRFAIIIQTLKWKTLELQTLQLLLTFFNMIDSEWKARVYWRYEFWNAGLADHFEHLNDLASKNSEIRSLLESILQDYEQDISVLGEQNTKNDKAYDFEALYKALVKHFKKRPYYQIIIKDILLRLMMIGEQENETEIFKELSATRAFLSHVLFFSSNTNIESPTQKKFMDMIQRCTMESDTARLNDHLQKTIDEKQQAKALQNVYYTNLRQVENENLKLRAHIEDPTKPLPPQFVVNVQSPKRSENTNSNHSPLKAYQTTSKTQTASKSSSSTSNVIVNKSRSNPPPAPPPLPASLKVGAPPAPPLPSNMSKSSGAPPAPPLPSLNSRPPPAPPLPSTSKGFSSTCAVPGPPAPLGAPILTGLNIKAPVGPKLPAYLKQKEDKMSEVPTRKLAGWESDQIPPKNINKNSIWVSNQDEELKFANDVVYSQLLKNFSRPVSDSCKAPVFKRKACKTVVVHDTDKLKGWEILSGKKIRNAKRFKQALIEVDMSQLNEEIIALVRSKLLDESIFKKLRETSIEKFNDAPDGEKLLATLSHITDLPKRLRAVYLILTFTRDCDALRSDASSIAEACDQIKNSAGLKLFAALVLVCCNYMMRTKTQRTLCYGYLMSLLPKLVETKDINNKLTLLDHLLIIFDRVTRLEHNGFGMVDFMQVEKARHLEFSHVVDSINQLSNQVNSIKSYHAKFEKLASNDQLGNVLDGLMPEFLKNVENLVHLKQSMESKVTELQEFFSYDPKKYKLENLFADIYMFSIHCKTSYEKLRALSAEKTVASSSIVPRLKVLQGVEKKRAPVFSKQDNNCGLLEKLEEELENKKYRPRTALTRGRNCGHRDLHNKENVAPRKKVINNDLELESLLSRVKKI